MTYFNIYSLYQKLKKYRLSLVIQDAKIFQCLKTLIRNICTKREYQKWKYNTTYLFFRAIVLPLSCAIWNNLSRFWKSINSNEIILYHKYQYIPIIVIESLLLLFQIQKTNLLLHFISIKLILKNLSLFSRSTWT